MSEQPIRFAETAKDSKLTDRDCKVTTSGVTRKEPVLNTEVKALFSKVDEPDVSLVAIVLSGGVRPCGC